MDQEDLEKLIAEHIGKESRPDGSTKVDGWPLIVFVRTHVAICQAMNANVKSMLEPNTLLVGMGRVGRELVREISKDLCDQSGVVVPFIELRKEASLKRDGNREIIFMQRNIGNDAKITAGFYKDELIAAVSQMNLGEGPINYIYIDESMRYGDTGEVVMDLFAKQETRNAVDGREFRIRDIEVIAEQEGPARDKLMAYGKLPAESIRALIRFTGGQPGVPLSAAPRPVRSVKSDKNLHGISDQVPPERPVNFG